MTWSATGERSLRLRSGARRRWTVLVELLVATAICVAGFAFGAPWMQVNEARWVVALLRLFDLDQVSGALPGHILIFGAEGAVLNAEVTASCSSILSVVGLTALTVAVFRGRRRHALAGLLAAVAAVLALNSVRLTASTLAGIWWGRPAMILFHDWVGSLWNFTATFLGFLVLVAVTLPARERAEQDAGGRHTARRPSSWARPGLGYQMPETDADSATRGRRLTGLIYRYLLPRRVAMRLAARREAGRIDYRIGHMPPAERAATVRKLAADGLGAHTASLLAVATYDQDLAVLDTLAEVIAARQWEPVTSHRVTSLRLWARGWMLGRAHHRPGTAPPAAPAQDGPTAEPPSPGSHDTQPIDTQPIEELTDAVFAPLWAGPGPPRPVLQVPPGRPPRLPPRRDGAAEWPRRSTPRNFARVGPLPRSRPTTVEEAP